MQASGWRFLGRRLLGLAVLAVLGIGLIETLLALVGGSVPRPPLYPGDVELGAEDPATTDPLIGWKLPPSTELRQTTDEYSCTYRSNGLGFRATREFEVIEGEDRIAFVGASFTFGAGVADDETFAAVLEQGLEDTACHNFGIGAFGVDQMCLTLEHYALPLRPRLVIAGLVRSTLERSLSAYRLDAVWRAKPAFTLRDGALVPLTRENAPPAFRRFVQQNSRILGVLRKTRSSLARRYPIGWEWRLNRALFERMRDACAREGIPLLVVHIPVNRRHPIPMFAGEFEDMGIAYLDLQPLLPADADALYYPVDSHFNAAGHRFAAQAIRSFLLERGWLDPSGRLSAVGAGG